MATDTAQNAPGEGDFGFQQLAVDGDYAMIPFYDERADTEYIQMRERSREGTWAIADLLEEPEGSNLYAGDIAISGEFAFVSDPQLTTGPGQSGKIYVHRRDEAGKWPMTQEIVNTYTGDFLELEIGRLGDIMAASSDYLVLLARVYSDDYVHNSLGLVYRREGDEWVFDDELEINVNCCDVYMDGTAVSVDGNRIVILNDASGDDPSAYIFDRSENGEWEQSATLNTRFYVYDDIKNVALLGDRMVIGSPAYTYNQTPYEAAVYVYELQAGGEWELVQTLQPENTEESGYFSYAVHLTKNYLLAIDESAAGDRGLIYLYRLQEDGNWELETTASPVNPEAEAAFPSGYYTYGAAALSDNSVIWVSEYESKDDNDEVYFSAAFFYDLAATYTLPATTTALCAGTAPRPAVTDNCSEDVTLSAEPAVFAEAGEYEVTWTALDAAGNRAVATQQVTVTEGSVSLPLVADFDNGTDTPDCWFADPAWRIVEGAYTLTPGGDETEGNYLALPALALEEGVTYAVSFRYRGISDDGGGRLLLGIDDGEVLFDDAAAPDEYQRVELLVTAEDSEPYLFAFGSPQGEAGDGILLDDIRVAEYLSPVADGANLLAGEADDACLTGVAQGVNGEAWSRVLTPDGKLLAEINAGGNELGDVTVSMTDYATAPSAPFTAAAQLGRYFNITPENGPGPYTVEGGVRIRLYVTDDELAELGTAAGQPLTWDNLIVTHYAGAGGDDCDLLNSEGGELTTEDVLATEDFGTTAHYVEFMTQTFSEFGITFREAVSITPVGTQPLTVLRSFPVPPDDVLTVAFAADRAGTLHLRLTDVFGRMVYTDRLEVRPGENQKDLSLANLPSGSYQLSASDGQRAAVVRLVKR